MKKINLIYIVSCVLLLIVPFIGMVWYQNTDAIENKELEDFPQFLTEESTVNLDYLEDMGIYFEDNFAYRSEMITANSVLRAEVFSTGSPQVIVGEEDWLYYTGTLSDYQSDNTMTELELNIFGHNMSLIKEFVEANGAEFYFTIAPNKNSLYSENMPWYHMGSNTATNYELVENVLEENGIGYIDLYESFEAQDEVLYYERDSHWNTKGAVLVYQTIMDALGLEYHDYSDSILEENHEGDIDSMLYPYDTKLEEDLVYQRVEGYTVVNEITDYMDSFIETSNSNKQGTLLMYRDSFGELIVPFLAEDFNLGYFSMNTPYYIEETKYRLPNYVIIEIVERNLRNLIEQAPILETLPVENITSEVTDSESTLTVKKDGSFFAVEGQIDEGLVAEDMKLYLQVEIEGKETVTYPLFLTVNNDGVGYKVYLNEDKVQQGSKLDLLYVGDGNYCVKSIIYEE